MNKVHANVALSDLQTDAEREILFRLARGEREISAGATHSLESVLDEAAKLLEDR